MYELEIKTSDYQEGAPAPAISSEAMLSGDISEPFERWLDSVKADPYSPLSELVSAEEMQQLVPMPAPSEKHSRFNGLCEMGFKGTLHVDGYFTGNVRSAQGTLVLEENGEINTDIEVGVAVIHGIVVGNIKARRRIELGSAARVIGDLYTPALTVEPGAIFEGKCYFGGGLGNRNGNGRRRKTASRSRLDESGRAKYSRGRHKPGGKVSKGARKSERRS
ncbi:MAG: polymer-forming cytoskeletal protein [Pyrinomonadaceae bacterium]